MFFILYHYNTIKKIKKQKTEIIKHISLSNFFKIFDNQKGKKRSRKVYNYTHEIDIDIVDSCFNSAHKHFSS